MRFVRAYTSLDTAEIAHVQVREAPFSESDPGVKVLDVLPDGTHKITTFQLHELGLAEDFAPTHTVTGVRCSPARHLFLRLEHVPGAKVADGEPVMARFRAKPGFERDIPAFHAVPTTVAGILRLARSKGPSAVHERVAAWLEFMGALGPHELEASGLPRMSLTLALELDAMRVARDVSTGSRAEVFKRQARQRIADRAALRVHANAVRAAQDAAE